jgi:hypothetical protein
MESALMVMEALEGYEEKIKFDIFGHSGEESELPFVKINQVDFLKLITLYPGWIRSHDPYLRPAWCQHPS